MHQRLDSKAAEIDLQQTLKRKECRRTIDTNLKTIFRWHQ